MRTAWRRSGSAWVLPVTVARIRQTPNQDLVSTETIFLQMRKVCELIAFGSLIANKAVYSQLHDTFAEDWRLGRIVEKLRKVNPDFFPVPVTAPSEIAPGHKHSGPSLALSITEARADRPLQHLRAHPALAQPVLGG